MNMKQIKEFEKQISKDSVTLKDLEGKAKLAIRIK